MPRNDYERPSRQQIFRVYRCRSCEDEQKVGYGQRAQMPCPYCGGFVEQVGETYPGDPDEWDEEREGHNINGRWRRKDGH